MRTFGTYTWPPLTFGFGEKREKYNIRGATKQNRKRESEKDVMKACEEPFELRSHPGRGTEKLEHATRPPSHEEFLHPLRMRVSLVRDAQRLPLVQEEGHWEEGAQSLRPTDRDEEDNGSALTKTK